MIYYYVLSGFIVLSAFISFCISVKALLNAKGYDEIAFVNSLYSLSRVFVIMFISAGTLIFKNDTYLIVTSLMVIIMQLFNGLIGIRLSMSKTLFPLFISIINATLLALFII